MSSWPRLGDTPKYPLVIKGGKPGNPLETGGSIAIAAIGKSPIVPKRSCIFQPAMFDDRKVATFFDLFQAFKWRSSMETLGDPEVEAAHNGQLKDALDGFNKAASLGPRRWAVMP